MIHNLFTRTCLVAFAACLLPSHLLTGAESTDSDGWKNLFKPDLSNAISPGEWKMKDGVLVAGDHKTLWTKESYGDFVLDLDFKVEKEANSGVFLRSSNPKNVLKALEIQVHASTDGTPHGMVAALYDCCSPSKDMAKPVGEWNHYTITCKGSLLSVVFNGEEVIHVDLDDWKVAHQNPDGSRNKFATPMKDYARRGPIGFQGLHGKAQAPVYYRNIRIKPLD